MGKHDIKFRSYKKYIGVISSIKVKTFHMKETTAKKGSSETTTSHQVLKHYIQSMNSFNIQTTLRNSSEKKKRPKMRKAFEEAVY